MRDLAFVDTHVHFHDHSHPDLRWDWLRPEVDADTNLGDFGAIRARRYTADDFLAETRFQHLGGVVHVQAAIGSADPVAETRWLQESSDRLGVPGAAIGYADLTTPGVADTLDRHAAYPCLKGIRDLRHDDHLDDPALAGGVRGAGATGADLLRQPPGRGHAAVRGRRRALRPGIPVCIDHAGFPVRRDDDYFRAWRRGMTALAGLEQSVVKISGLGMCDHRWTVASIRPWVETCIELWGPGRAFFGTNWPVDRLFSSYGDVVDADAAIIARASRDDPEALFSGNARRFFGLGDRPAPALAL